MSQHQEARTVSQARASRSRALLGLEFPATADFDNAELEWRRLFSELFGTFLLVVVGAGGAVVAATSHGAVTRAAAVTAPGLMVMAIILFMGAVSGAHLNPAVTLSFTLRGDFPWRRVPGYIVVHRQGGGQRREPRRDAARGARG
jgi:aquaporin Z